VAKNVIDGGLLDNAASGNGMGGRSIHGIATDELHTDRAAPEPRIIERQVGEVRPHPRHEYIRGSIVRLGSRCAVDACGHPRPYIAFRLIEGAAHVAAALRPPNIVHVCAEILGQKLDDLVLEALSGTIRER
jgi:hypothetical protein